MTFTITRNTPEPVRTMLGRKSKYRFSELEVDDAIDGPLSERGKLANAARHYDKRNGTKHSVYALNDKTVRCRRMS